jgi:hypothetical protein
VTDLASTPQRNVEPFSLLGGPLHKIGRRFGLVRGTNTVRLGLALGVGLWLIVVILGLLGGRMDQLFELSVVGGHARLLLVIPLFFMCESWADPLMTGFVGTIASAGIVPPGARSSLNAEVTRANRRANAWWPEAVWLSVAVLVEVAGSGLGMYGTSGVYDPSRTGETLSAFMYFRVGVTLFRFLVFRWTWKLVLWSWFIWRVSRLDLRLIPGHSDRDGGLGAIEAVHERFSLLVAAYSILHCASLAESIAAGTLVVGATISSWVAMVLLVDAVLFICPLLVFTDKLWASRTAGLARYQMLAARYATEFEARWTDGTVPEGAPLLGTSDIQSMADLDHTVKGVKEMRWITVGPRMLTMMTVAGIGPFLPLLLFKYPIADLAQRFLSKLIGL